MRDVLRMIATGEIVDGKTVSAMLYALNAGVVSALALAAVPRRFVDIPRNGQESSP